MGKFFFVFVFFCSALSVQAEEISNFNSQIEVKKDGTVFVTETILYDFGSSQLHGIFRTLQEQHPQKATVWYKKRIIGIDVQSVQKNGVDEPYVVTDKGTDVEVKIGDADITISGVHTYTIKYKLTGALSYGPLGSELYYNVTGDNWLVPIAISNAVVVDQTGTLIASSSECYVGVYGDTSRCIKGIKTATSSIFTADLLSPGSGLTIAQELTANEVAVLINEEVSVPWIWYLLGVVWLFGLSIWAYRFRTAFKSKKPVIAQYEPYAGILPMYTGVLFDGKLDPRDITSGIVYLAQQGFIKIRKSENKVLFLFEINDYVIELLRSATEVENQFLRSVLDLLFVASSEIGSFTSLRTIKYDTSRKTSNSLILLDLKKSIVNELKKDGYLFEEFTFKFLSWKVCLALVVVGIGFINLEEKILWCLLVLASIVILTLAQYSRRTAKGYEAQNHLKGFKLFLSVTEKERYKFFNAPDKSPELFMEYLPYAIAFGVEKEWSKVFEDITILNPSWYEGGSMSAFSATALASDIGAFSTSFATSSGVSGSSGGGSSGGGGGGGGGGSW